MGRRFTESEVLAMTRNRREDKALKERLHRLSEERGLYHDNLKKEKTKISQFCIESQRTSGNSPCPDCQVACEKSDHVTPREMQRHNKPWSVTPSESTFNVLFQQNNFATPESRKFRRRSSSLRKSSESRTEETECTSVSTTGNSEYSTQQNGQEGSLNISDESRVLSSTPVSNKVLISDDVAGDCGQYSYSFTDRSNKGKTLRISSTKSGKTDRNMNVSSPFQETIQAESFDNKSKTTDTTKKQNCQNLKKELGQLVHDCDAKTNDDEKETQKRFDIDNVLEETGDKLKSERVKDKSCEPEIDKASKEKALFLDQPPLPVLEEVPNEEADEKSEQEYMMVYTIRNDEQNTENRMQENGALTHIGGSSNTFLRSQSSSGDRQIQIVDVALENDGSAAITLSHVEKQRPHTVAGGELITEDSELKSQPDVDHRNFMWFKGKKLHDYVKPQDRYKHDPFKMKKREKLMKKLATETPVFAEDQREQILNVEMTFSKATRARLLKQLVEENSTKRQTSSRNSYEQSLNSKIGQFMKSIEDFCTKQRQN